MRLITFLLPLLLLATFFPARAGGHKEIIPIYLRIHIQTAGEGLPETEATTVALPSTGETIQIRTLPEITERELVDVRTLVDGGVRLIFNHQGSINLNAVTAQNQGRLLIVMINGVIIYAPVIDEQLNSGWLDIPHPMNPHAVALLKQTADENVKNASKS